MMNSTNKPRVSGVGATLARLCVVLFAASMSSSLLGAGVVLTMWDNEREDIQKVLDDVLDRFEKENPGVKVKTSHYKTEDLRSQFQTAAMGGGGADIVLAPNDFGGPFSVMGIIQPVDTWAKMDRFAPTVVEAVSDSKNKSWGVPISRGNHLMLFINGSIVKKAPQTIEELIATAKKHTDAKQNRYGFAYNLNEPFWFVAFLGAYGQRPLVARAPQLGGDTMVQALELVKKLKFDDKVVPADCDYACADTLFTEGKAAMIINGDWAVQQYREKFKENLVIAPLPKLASTGKHMAPMISGKYLFFNKRVTGVKLEAAKKLTEYLVSKPIQEELVRRTQRLPAIKELNNSPIIAADPVLAATDKAMANGQPMPLDAEMRVVWDAIRPQLQNVMAGRAETKVAAATMQKDAETKIKEMKQ